MRALWPNASREQAKSCALRQVKPHITHFCCNQVTLSKPPHIMNWNSLAQFIHILAVVLWIGGIVFMDGFLAPALRRATDRSTSAGDAARRRQHQEAANRPFRSTSARSFDATLNSSAGPKA
ncbi:MAG: hypothetical protein ACP5GC_10485, partial [Thiomonas sp.]